MNKTSKYIVLACAAVAGFFAGETLYTKSQSSSNDQFFKLAENTKPGIWDKTKDVASDVWDGTKEVSSDVWDGTKKVSADVWDGTKQVGADIKDGFTDDESKEDSAAHKKQNKKR